MFTSPEKRPQAEQREIDLLKEFPILYPEDMENIEGYFRKHWEEFQKIKPVFVESRQGHYEKILAIAEEEKSNGCEVLALQIFLQNEIEETTRLKSLNTLLHNVAIEMMRKWLALLPPKEEEKEKPFLRLIKK